MRVDHYILEAFKKGQAYREKHWVINAFSTTMEKDPNGWKKNWYPYKLVKFKDGVYFCADDKPGELQPILGMDNQPLKGMGPIVQIKDKLELEAGDIANYTASGQKLVTTYGNLLANYILLVYPFGTKIPYQTGRFSAGKIESLIVRRLVSDPEDIAVEDMDNYAQSDQSSIFVHEYLKFTQGAMYLTNFSQLLIPGDSERSLVTDPTMPEFKEQLLKQYEGQLHDPAVRAKITQEIVKKDKEWMAGDSSLGLLNVNESKSFDVIRKKRHGLVGDEAGFSTGSDVPMVINSLSQGYQIQDLVAMFDSSRAASFDRGASTALSGVEVKWLRRLGATVGVVAGDCGTKLGRRLFLTEENKHLWDGFNIVKDNGELVPFDKDQIGSYLGKAVTLRLPHFCKQPGNDLCSSCSGPRLAENPNSVSTYLALIGDIFMGLFLKSMHGKSVQTVEYNPDIEIF